MVLGVQSRLTPVLQYEFVGASVGKVLEFLIPSSNQYKRYEGPLITSCQYTQPFLSIGGLCLTDMNPPFLELNFFFLLVVALALDSQSWSKRICFREPQM